MKNLTILEYALCFSYNFTHKLKMIEKLPKIETSTSEPSKRLNSSLLLVNTRSNVKLASASSSNESKRKTLTSIYEDVTALKNPGDAAAANSISKKEVCAKFYLTF